MSCKQTGNTSICPLTYMYMGKPNDYWLLKGVCISDGVAGMFDSSRMTQSAFDWLISAADKRWAIGENEAKTLHRFFFLFCSMSMPLIGVDVLICRQQCRRGGAERPVNGLCANSLCHLPRNITCTSVAFGKCTQQSVRLSLSSSIHFMPGQNYCAAAMKTPRKWLSCEYQRRRVRKEKRFFFKKSVLLMRSFLFVCLLASVW